MSPAQPPTEPSRRAEVAAMGATLASVVVALLPRLNWVTPNEDGGVTGSWAMQLAAGQVPYRDFFVFTTPGAVVLYGALFKLAGAGYLAARVLTAAAVLAAAACLYLLARELLPRAWAAVVTLLWSTWLGVFFQYGPHHHWGTAGLLLMALAVVRRRFVVAGLAASLAVVFIQSAAIAVVAGLVAALLVEPAWRRSLLPMATSGAVATLPWLAWLVWSGALAGFWDQAVVFTIRTYPAVNALPFPVSPLALHGTMTFEYGAAGVWLLLFGWFVVVAAPLLIAAAAAVSLFRHPPPAAQPAWVVLAVLSSGLFASVVSARLTAPLGWFAAPLALVLIAARLRRLTGDRLLPALPAAAIVVTGLTPLPLGYALSCDLNPRSSWRPVDSAGVTLCVQAINAPAMTAALAFVSEHRGQPVAFLPLADSFYLFTGETPPVSTPWVIPGLETPGQLAALDRDLRSGRVPFVVYYMADLRSETPADAALFAPGPTPFDRMLERYYRRVPNVDVGGSPLWEWTGPGG